MVRSDPENTRAGGETMRLRFEAHGACAPAAGLAVLDLAAEIQAVGDARICARSSGDLASAKPLCE
jgi:hypothetical protein